MKIRALASKWRLLVFTGFFPLHCLACLPAQYSVPTASINDFYESNALIALVSAHEPVSGKAKDGNTHFKVVRWLKGSGPDVIHAKGFPLRDEQSPMSSSCSLGTLYPGKQYIVILDGLLVDGVAKAFGEQSVAGKLVVQRAWEAP